MAQDGGRRAHDGVSESAGISEDCGKAKARQCGVDCFDGGDFRRSGSCRLRIGQGGDGFRAHTHFEERNCADCPAHSSLLRRSPKLHLSRLDGRAADTRSIRESIGSSQSHGHDGPAADRPAWGCCERCGVSLLRYPGASYHRPDAGDCGRNGRPVALAAAGD